MSINIQLNQFEGPIALLLYLIRKEEMDIMDININEITKQYLDYIRIMKELDLEVAGEFIAMASTLIHIKSKMLLPQYDENGELLETEDPRKELVQRLLEYQKYSQAAKTLYERPIVGRDLWLRGVRESLQPKEEEIEVEDNALYVLISSYRKMLRALKKKVHNIAQKTQSIASRILEIKDRLHVGVKTTLSELIDATENQSRQILITFLSLLELGKMGFVTIYQGEPFSDIWIDPKKPIETDVISRVEEYDNIHAEQKANELLAKAESISEEDQLFNEQDQLFEQSQTQLLTTDQFALTDQSIQEYSFDENMKFAESDSPGAGSVDNLMSGLIDESMLASDEELLAAEKELNITSDDNSNETSSELLSDDLNSNEDKGEEPNV